MHEFNGAKDTKPKRLNLTALELGGNHEKPTAFFIIALTFGVGGTEPLWR